MFRRRNRTHRRKPRRSARRKKPLRRIMRPSMRMIRSPIPERIFVKLRYSEISTVTCAVAYQLYQFATYSSSVYDPNKSGIGHQPMWRDQYATLYQEYRVRGFSYRVQAANRNANEAGWFGVNHSSIQAITDTDIQNWCERRTAKVRMLGGLPGGSSKSSVKGYLSVAKTNGVAPTVVAHDDRYFAQVGTDPPTMAFLQVAAQGAWAGQVFDVQVDLTYYVEFFDLVTPSPS